MNEVLKSMDIIVNAISDIRLSLSKDEFSMYESINTILSKNEISFSREVNIGGGSRLDYLCDNIAIEVKRGKPNRKILVKQIGRYMTSPSVESLILVVERNVDLPEIVGSKPCFVLSLNKQWGIAL